jgi:hypothetical protein
MNVTDRMNFVFRAHNKVPVTIANDQGVTESICDRYGPWHTRTSIIWSIITNFLDNRGIRRKPNPNPPVAEKDT